jgi:hypothetical protein
MTYMRSGKSHRLTHGQALIHTLGDLTQGLSCYGFMFEIGRADHVDGEHLVLVGRLHLETLYSKKKPSGG